MTIDKLKPGLVVYDVHSYKAGNTNLRSMGTWHVQIVSVDLETRTVTAHWNSNAATKFSERKWKKWRLTKPVMVSAGFGTKRLATKVELAVAKATAPKPEAPWLATLLKDVIERPQLAVDRISALEAALKPFAKFGNRLMDGRSAVPKSGPWYGLDSGCPTEATLDIEHFKAAIALV